MARSRRSPTRVSSIATISDGTIRRPSSGSPSSGNSADDAGVSWSTDARLASRGFSVVGVVVDAHQCLVLRVALGGVGDDEAHVAAVDLALAAVRLEAREVLRL